MCAQRWVFLFRVWEKVHNGEYSLFRVWENSAGKAQKPATERGAVQGQQELTPPVSLLGEERLLPLLTPGSLLVVVPTALLPVSHKVDVSVFLRRTKRDPINIPSS